QLVQVREVVLVLDRDDDLGAGGREGEDPLADAHGGVHFLDDPVLGLGAAPTIDQSPGRVAREAAAGHGILLLDGVASRAAAPVLQAASGDAEDVVGPGPDHGAVGDAGAHHAVEDGAERLDVVVTDAGIEPQLIGVAPDALERGETLV